MELQHNLFFKIDCCLFAKKISFQFDSHIDDIILTSKNFGVFMKSYQKGSATLPIILFSIAAIIGIFLLVHHLNKETPAMESVQSGSFNVEKLFTNDGCSVYRFHDAGYYRYYSKCSGSTSSDTSYSYSESCGKNCTREVKTSTPTGYASEVPLSENVQSYPIDERTPIPPTH